MPPQGAHRPLIQLTGLQNLSGGGKQWDKHSSKKDRGGGENLGGGKSGSRLHSRGGGQRGTHHKRYKFKNKPATRRK